MDDGIKIFLQVYPLAQAVGADEHPLLFFGEGCHAGLTFRWRERAGYGFYSAFLPFFAVRKYFTEFLSQVFGRSDEAAEYNGGKAILQQIFDMRDALLQFVIIGTFQIFCKICQVGKAPAFQGCCLCFLAAGIGARQCVRYTAVFAGIPIQNALAAPGIEVIGILFACINAIRSGA